MRMTCSDDGSWNTPVCERIECPAPDPVYTGLYSCTDDFYFKSVCTLKCPGPLGVRGGCTLAVKFQALEMMPNIHLYCSVLFTNVIIFYFSRKRAPTCANRTDSGTSSLHRVNLKSEIVLIYHRQMTSCTCALTSVSVRGNKHICFFSFVRKV